MHQGYNNLETIIEDEFWDENFESGLKPHDNYGIELIDRYLDDPRRLELDKSVKGIQDDTIEPNLGKNSITELKPDWEIRESTIESPTILRYLK